MRRIYVASSWRNDVQPSVVAALREAGHQVYDFRRPNEQYDNHGGPARGFHSSEIDPNWGNWTPAEYVVQLQIHPLARQGFESDWGAMQWADTGVLVLPSGRSAHLEGGYFTGARKQLFVLIPGEMEPELMYLMATAIVLNIPDLIESMRSHERQPLVAHDGLRVGRV
jgi:hypothetical protein